MRPEKIIPISKKNLIDCSRFILLDEEIVFHKSNYEGLCYFANSSALLNGIGVIETGFQHDVLGYTQDDLPHQDWDVYLKLEDAYKYYLALVDKVNEYNGHTTTTTTTTSLNIEIFKEIKVF